MAKSLKILIEMAGAEEIKRQLEGVGQAGEEAFHKIIGAAKEAGGFKELDPSIVTKTIEDLGVKGPEAIGKITQAVKSASKMETLVNALTSVENGLAGIQKAATAVDGALGKQLIRSLTIVARLFPAAFAAATVGAIVNATKSVLELDKAAIQLGTSIGEVAKSQEVFRQIGVDASTAAKGVADFFEKMNLDAVKKAIKEIDEGMATFTGLDALKRAAAGFGEAADLARKKLEEMGKLDSKLTPAARAIDDIKKSTMGASQQMLAMLQVFGTMGNTAARNQLIFANFSKELGTLIIQALNAGVSFDEVARQIASFVPPTAAAAAAAFRLSMEWQKLKNLFTGQALSAEGLNEIAASLELIRSVAEYIGSIPFIAGSMNMGNTLRELQFIGQVLTEIANFATTMWDGMLQAAQTAWETVIGWIGKAIDALRQFLGMGGGGATAGADAGGFARGGMIGGRGSGTSDSNLAWVSRGEHIMPARTVAAPGVLAFLEALRRSGGNLRGVLDRMGHFALGGMVRAPAFAGGGMVGGMSNVTIQFPGLNPITGLRASSAVVDELRRSAALAQVRSGGRKPSRYS